MYFGLLKNLPGIMYQCNNKNDMYYFYKDKPMYVDVL